MHDEPISRPYLLEDPPPRPLLPPFHSRHATLPERYDNPSHFLICRVSRDVTLHVPGRAHRTHRC
jgi:hypothetical protein